MQALGWPFLFFSWRLDSCRREIWSTGLWPGETMSVPIAPRLLRHPPPPILRRILKKMGLRVRETLKMDVG